MSEKLDDNLNINQWVQFSKKTLSEFKKMLKPNGVAVFVIGDVTKSEKSMIPLAPDFALMVKENNLFKIFGYFQITFKVQIKQQKYGERQKERRLQLIEL
ncbi:MAG: DNA methyltransferase [Flavobacteriaceae bacterium]